MVKFVSELKAKNEPGEAKMLFWQVTKWCVIGCLLLLPFMIIGAPIVMGFLHISSSLSFILIYILFVFSLLSMLIMSLLQGYQQFVWVSILGAISIVIKLVLSIPVTSFGVVGVMGATVAASIIMYAIYFLPLKKVFQAALKKVTLTKRKAFTFAVPTLFAILGVTSLYSTDVILVRHFFSATDAGLYAALAILGKVIFYASSAVSLVLFPVLSERSTKGEQTHKLILSGIGGVALLSFAIVGFYFCFPTFVIHMLFGNAYTGASALLGMFGIFLALFSIGSIFVNVCLAIGKTKVWMISFGCAVLQIIGISVFHTTIVSVVWINIAIAALLVMGVGGYYMGSSRSKG
jgi:O-antigen/teichoic acid export membrane protein